MRQFAEIAFSNISEFAAAMGWGSASAAYGYFKDAKEPGAPVLKKLHDLGCNVNWLLFNIGEMFAENEAGRKLREDYFKKVKVAGTIVPESEKEKNIRESIEAARVTVIGDFPDEAGKAIESYDRMKAAATPQAPKKGKKK